MTPPAVPVAARPASPSGPSTLDALVEALTHALADECRALAAGDLDGLHAAVARKAEVLSDLAPRLRAAPATLRTLLAPALDAARRSNEDNARLLAARMVPHRARLDALIAAARRNGAPAAAPTGATYGASGAHAGVEVARQKVGQA